MTVHVGNLRLHVFYAVDFVDAGEFGYERLHPFRLALSLV